MIFLVFFFGATLFESVELAGSFFLFKKEVMIYTAKGLERDWPPSC